MGLGIPLFLAFLVLSFTGFGCGLGTPGGTSPPCVERHMLWILSGGVLVIIGVVLVVLERQGWGRER